MTKRGHAKSNSPMAGIADEPAESPIDRENAEDLDPVQKAAQEGDPNANDPLFPAADNVPMDRYAFLPTGGTRISSVVESIALMCFQMLNVPAPPPGAARSITLLEPYFQALTPETQAFFHRVMPAEQEKAPDA